MAPIGKNHLIAACLAIVAGFAGCGDKEQPKPRTGAIATPPVATPAAPSTSSAPLPTSSVPAAAAAPPAAVLPSATAPEPTPSAAAPATAPLAAAATAPTLAAPSPPALTAGSSPTPVPAPAPAILASQEFSNDPSLRADILEVKRVSGGALLVKWRLSRPAAASAGGLAAPADEKGVYHSFSWSNVYVTDPAENKKYSGLKDSGGHWIGQGDNKTYARGQQQAMWMKFPAPPAPSTKVSFVFSGFAPFDDLPVSQ